MNAYRCIACSATREPDFDGFVCPDCGGNLDIEYEYTGIDQNFAGGVGIFRYSSLLPVSDPGASYPLVIGGTPLISAQRLGASIGLQNLYIKDDTRNPSASFKDRATAIALQRAVDTGADTISVASTGNAGSSTACIAAALGLRAIVFVPQSAPPAKLAQALAYGATVIAVRGNYDDAYELCREASVEFGWFNRSTGINPYTREGKKTCTFEIWEQLGRVPDRIVVPSGDGNILSGIWKGWRDLDGLGLVDTLPKIDCVQSTASAAISHSVERCRNGGDTPDWRSFRVDVVDATTVADSISVCQPRDGLAAVKAVIESGGEALTVPDEDILAAIPEIARTTGVFAEPAAAAPWAALKRAVAENRVAADDTVVLLVTGNGLKDIAAAGAATGEPAVVDANLESLRAVLQST
jgi:threonine synthase